MTFDYLTSGMNEPYRLVPSQTKENMSRRLAVAVSVGVIPAGHLNTLFHVIVLLPDPS